MVLSYTLVCICYVFDVFGDQQSMYGQILLLGPLYLACVVIMIALFKIQKSIKTSLIGRLHSRMLYIHVFNIITFTSLVTAKWTASYVKTFYDKHGSQEDKLHYFESRNVEAYLILIKNLFKVYLDGFVLYIILAFTKERANRTEQTSYDHILQRYVPNIVFMRNQQILD